MSADVLCTAVVTLMTAVLLTPLPATANDYCDLTCDGEKHVLCLFPNPGLSPNCSLPVNVTASHVSAEDIEVILHAHNQIRENVRRGRYRGSGLPPAKSMPPLKWDEELARIAQHLLNQCLGAETARPCMDVHRWKVGSLGIRLRYNVTCSGFARPRRWNRLVREFLFKWELPNFQQGDLTYHGALDKVSGKSINFMTQIIWANTTRVGCGFLVHRTDQHKTGMFRCNYGPSGNIVGSNIYEEKEE